MRKSQIIEIQLIEHHQVRPIKRDRYHALDSPLKQIYEHKYQLIHKEVNGNRRQLLHL
ncbi:MAG: hypothetical protein HC796_09430 [Synechococcaceae cyanobacterium RL_1_2]|nr:hypothetical protein [Synechococcaceae cyanobacterium RL_1_2]